MRTHDPVNEQWGDVNDRPQGGPNTCKWCGRNTNSLSGECGACRHTECHCEPVTPTVFVLWRGERIGFETQEKAEGFIEEFRKSHDPAVYCGPPVEAPVLETVPEPMAVAK